jgi:hypothetical protein
MDGARALMPGGIHAHSIIPTLQDGPLEDRDDGVVKYKSAHIDGVESEVVIEHSGHSTQGNPLTVREVRRILIEELGRPGRAIGGTGPTGGLRPGRRAKADSSHSIRLGSVLVSRMSLTPGHGRRVRHGGRRPA